MTNVNVNKVDDSMIITRIVGLATIMVVKRIGQSKPSFRFLRTIPDVLLMPSTTVLALTTAKLYRIIFQIKQMAS